MKKLMSILLAVLMLVSILASCGGNDITTTTELPTTAAPTTEAPTTESPTTETPTTELPTTEIPTTRPVGEYSISYELNGGINNENNPSIYNTGDTITLSYPTKDDYMFMGWFTDSEFTNEIKQINDIEGNLTLYAKWVDYEEIFDFEKYENEYAVKINPDYSVDRIIIPSTYKNLPVVKLKLAYDDKDWTVKTVIIPSTVTSISEYGIIAIRGNKEFLEEIKVDQNNPNYKSVDGVLYSKDGTTLIQYPANKSVEEYTIPCGVTSINKLAFDVVKNLKSVTIPDGVTYIGSSAFFKCEKLESIIIPNTVIELEKNSFFGCVSLKSVTLSENINIIPEHAFSDCCSLESIVIPHSVKIIDRYAFKDCVSLKNVILPDGLYSLYEESFSNCGALEKIVIPKNTTNVSSHAFYDCPSLIVCFESKKTPNLWVVDDLNYSGAIFVEKVIFGYTGD